MTSQDGQLIPTPGETPTPDTVAPTVNPVGWAPPTVEWGLHAAGPEERWAEPTLQHRDGGRTTDEPVADPDATAEADELGGLAGTAAAAPVAAQPTEGEPAADVTAPDDPAADDPAADDELLDDAADTSATNPSNDDPSKFESSNDEPFVENAFVGDVAADAEYEVCVVPPLTADGAAFSKVPVTFDPDAGDHRDDTADLLAIGGDTPPTDDSALAGLDEGSNASAGAVGASILNGTGTLASTADTGPDADDAQTAGRAGAADDAGAVSDVDSEAADAGSLGDRSAAESTPADATPADAASYQSHFLEAGDDEPEYVAHVEPSDAERAGPRGAARAAERRSESGETGDVRDADDALTAAEPAEPHVATPPLTAAAEAVATGEAVPADGVAMPAEGVAMPAEGVAMPAEGVAVPADEPRGTFARRRRPKGPAAGRATSHRGGVNMAAAEPVDAADDGTDAGRPRRDDDHDDASVGEPEPDPFDAEARGDDLGSAAADDGYDAGDEQETDDDEGFVDDEEDDDEAACAAAGSTGGWWTIPMVSAGVAVIACCLVIPQADANRRLAYERAALRADLDAVQTQVATNDEFLRKLAGDPTLAERLAHRQLNLQRPGTRVLPVRHGEPGTSPFDLVQVQPPPAAGPYQPLGGRLAAVCRDARTRLYATGAGLFLLAAGLVLGAGGADRRHNVHA